MRACLEHHFLQLVRVRRHILQLVWVLLVTSLQEEEQHEIILNPPEVVSAESLLTVPKEAAVALDLLAADPERSCSLQPVGFHEPPDVGNFQRTATWEY